MSSTHHGPFCGCSKTDFEELQKFVRQLTSGDALVDNRETNFHKVLSHQMNRCTLSDEWERIDTPRTDVSPEIKTEAQKLAEYREAAEWEDMGIPNQQEYIDHLERVVIEQKEKIGDMVMKDYDTRAFIRLKDNIIATLDDEKDFCVDLYLKAFGEENSMRQENEKLKEEVERMKGKLEMTDYVVVPPESKFNKFKLKTSFGHKKPGSRPNNLELIKAKKELEHARSHIEMMRKVHAMEKQQLMEEIEKLKGKRGN
ncbi:hypothetical protein GCK72_015998 [Caenorhabditis remanei]|uniref:Uncharacterized protein n=1 Tax=Caenorhabditis remanei TaxID=31234 RepID=A0A6A5GXW5_CAERE|nr:hypothetical protein GCK72_015998 [Caenorhabditis remanei]KAF1759531.1 hypothetical protein GCK72_015998 [Caenorhabditis remanei]